MKALILATVLALGGCTSMTTVKTVHGPKVMPTPSNNPEIQPELDHFEVTPLGKVALVALVGFCIWGLWRWDDD